MLRVRLLQQKEQTIWQEITAECRQCCTSNEVSFRHAEGWGMLPMRR